MAPMGRAYDGGGGDNNGDGDEREIERYLSTCVSSSLNSFIISDTQQENTTTSSGHIGQTGGQAA